MFLLLDLKFGKSSQCSYELLKHGEIRGVVAFCANQNQLQRCFLQSKTPFKCIILFSTLLALPPVPPLCASPLVPLGFVQSILDFPL